MIVSYERLTDPSCVRGPLNATCGKNMYSKKWITLDTWRGLLRTCGGTPHSPVRAVIYRFYFEGVPTFVSVHLVRHHIGVQPYVQSQREDKTKIPREDRRQTDLVNMLFDINPNGLLSIAKARLCSKASIETREVVIAIKKALEGGDEYDKAVAAYMMAPCEWYKQCFEMRPCKKIAP
jgi:thymidylate synthase ThyX